MNSKANIRYVVRSFQRSTFVGVAQTEVASLFELPQSALPDLGRYAAKVSAPRCCERGTGTVARLRPVKTKRNLISAREADHLIGTFPSTHFHGMHTLSQNTKTL